MLQLSADQRRAEERFASWWKNTDKPMLTLGGYAGTGKTTLTGHLTKTFVDEPVAFCTFTGKASTVLAKSLARAGVDMSRHYCGTIHRLIYEPQVDQYERVVGWSRRDEMPYKAIIVDEASMVPKRIIDDLASYHVPIFAVGDHGQLPPVEDRTGYLMASPDLRLEEVHRQALDNPIIALSMHVRQGGSPSTFRSPDERVRTVRGSRGIVEACQFVLPNAEAVQSGLMLCATNNMRTRVNAFARHHLGFSPLSTGQEPQAPQVGETVICLKNAYLPGGVFVANGMRGVIKNIGRTSEHHYTADVALYDQEGLAIDGKRLCLHQFGRSTTFKGTDEIPGRPWNMDAAGLLFDFGYGLTTHKAQGSQAERVGVVLETWPNDPDDRRRWLYTSVTRAAQHLVLVEP